MHPSAPTSPRAARRAARLTPLALLAAMLAPCAGVSAADGTGVWASSTKGLSIRGVSSLRITQKTPEIWYASIFGPKKTRGLCENTTKGAKPWVARMVGLDEATSERDAWRITLDPKDDKTIYAVGGGKIYKSVNAGATFEFSGSGTTTFSFDRSQSRALIAGVEVDPSNSKRLLAGTLASGFFGGLFETKDAAKTWTQIAGTGDRKELEQSGLGDDAWPIALDKGSDKFILVGGPTTSASLSQNRGGSFKSTQPGGTGVHLAHAMTQMAGREVFLAESRGLWRSRDAGESWGKTPILQGDCLSVDVDPGNRKLVYAILRGKGLYRTENLQTWDGPNHPEIDAHEVVCHPHQKNTILLCSRTTGLWISTDRGETVTPLVEGVPEAIPAITHVAAHPAAPASWLAVGDTGQVFASADRGQSWAKAGHVGGAVTGLVADPAAAGSFLATGSTILSTTDGGTTWAPLFIPSDVEERVLGLRRLADGTWIALLERDARVIWSRDGGKTWDKEALKRPASTKTAWGAALAVDARDANHLLMATRTISETFSKDDREGGPYESRDGGLTWTLLDEGFKSDKGVMREGWNRGAVCAIDPESGTLHYGATGVGLFHREAAADGKPAPWVASALTGAPAEPAFSALLVPTRPVGAPMTIVVQLEGLVTRALLESGDGGKTFVALPDPGVRLASLAEDPALAGRWLAGDPVGDRGVLTFDPTTGVPPITAPTAPVGPGPTPVVEAPKPPAGLVAFSCGKDKRVLAWDLAAGKGFDGAAAAEPAELLGLCLAADSSSLFAASADKSVHVYDGRSGAPVRRLEGHAGAVQCVATTADGATVYAGDAAFSIHAWDVAQGKDLGTLSGHTGAVMSLALSRDGTRLCSGSTDKSVRVWDTASRKELFNIPGHPGEVWAVALSADGTRIYVGGRDASIRVYDGASGGPVAAWQSTMASVSALCVSPEGSLLYVAGEGKELVALGTGDGQPMFRYTGSAAPLTCATLSADGEWIVAGAEDGLVRLWKKGRAEVVWTSPKVHGDAIHGVVAAVEPVAKPPEPPGPTPGPTPPAMGEAPPAPAPGMDAPPTPAPAMGEAPAPAMDAPPAPAPAMGEVPAPAMDAPPAPAMEAPAAPAMGEAPAPAMGDAPAPTPTPSPKN